ncbi:MAG: hypothetical protein HY901_21605 [Deltaproteobacteria bacterium]|nr:hypothetical protein [Deltaproteobacteria bacterium]
MDVAAHVPYRTLVNAPEAVSSFIDALVRWRWLRPSAAPDLGFIEERLACHAAALASYRPIAVLPVRIVSSWREAQAAAWAVAEAGHWLAAYKSAARATDVPHTDPRASVVGDSGHAVDAVVRGAAMVGARSRWPVDSRPTWAAAKCAAEWAAWTARLHARMLAAESSRPDPWVSLLDLYERGSWPIGPDRNAYVVFHLRDGPPPDCLGR